MKRWMILGAWMTIIGWGYAKPAPNATVPEPFVGTWTMTTLNEMPVAWPELWLEVLAETSPDGMARVFINTYCGVSKADFLLFQIEPTRLVYAGEEWAGRRLDNGRILSMVLSLENGKLEMTLREAEHGLEVMGLMRREPMAILGGWACTAQTELLTILQEGNFNLYDAQGHMRGLAEAFGMTNPEEDLYYLQEWLPGWPMYEEACVRAAQPIVWLGTLEPGGTLRMYVVDWTEDTIYLYESPPEPGSADGWFPMRRGPLAWTIVPGFPLPDVF